MKSSEQIDLVSKALVAAQKEIKNALKDTQGARGKYADMSSVVDAVKEPLNKNGVAFLQLVRSGEVDMVETILLHESGQYISTETKVYCLKPNDPQAFGSGITYSKRYALMAAVGLPTEDDDGDAATKKARPQSKVDEPVTEWSKKQVDFAEKLKQVIEETEIGKGLDLEKVKKYLVWHYKQGGLPVSEDDKRVPDLASFILKKPDTLKTLKAEVK